MSHWLVIEGDRFDIQEALGKASIRTLVDLQKSAGISVNTIVDTLAALGEMEDPRELFNSVERLYVFAALVFLCRRKAGEKLSFDDATEVSLADVRIDFEDDEAEVASDPKDPQTLEERDAG
jgi:uncharacterized protein (DUF433 family)